MAVTFLRAFLPVELPTGLSVPARHEGGIHKRKQRWCLYSLYTGSKYACTGFDPEGNGNFLIRSNLVAGTEGEMAVSSEQRVYDVVLKQAALVKEQRRTGASLDVKPDVVVPGTMYLLKEAYDRCGDVCAEYAKTFYLGTLLMTPERRRAIWAIYASFFPPSKNSRRWRWNRWRRRRQQRRWRWNRRRRWRKYLNKLRRPPC